MADELGDRMKLYEAAEAGRKFMPLLPIMARVDGRAFHSFTRGMARPFDEVLRSCMVDTTAELVKQTGADMGYTQSDEISLTWYNDTTRTQTWFNGRVQKMNSQLAAIATLEFYRLVLERMPQYASRKPTFDARVWNVPTTMEGANVFLWREWDATKNSISMAAQSMFSHRELDGKDSSEKQELMFSKGVNWNDYPAWAKRGTYVQRRRREVPFTVEELEKLPLRHAARTNPDLKVLRSVVGPVDLPPLGKIVNRVDVIYEGAEPILASE